MPAIVLKQSAPAGKVSFKKDVDQVEPDEAETIYHEHDDDAMSESSRWSGESEIQSRTSGAYGELGQSRTPSFKEELDKFITSI